MNYETTPVVVTRPVPIGYAGGPTDTGLPFMFRPEGRVEFFWRVETLGPVAGLVSDSSPVVRPAGVVAG